MQETIQTTPSPDGQDLARWLGRREAFGMIAGRCSAADIECLRQIRDRKLYLEVAPNWDQFCTRHLKASRRKIDLNIHYLDEFGPWFYFVSQLTRITPEECRAIAGHFTDEGVTLNGEVIALIPENSERIAEAVEQLRAECAPPPRRKAAADFDALIKRCDALAALLEKSPPSLEIEQRLALSSAIRRIYQAAARHGVMLL